MSVEQIFNQTTPQYSNLWEFAIIPNFSFTSLSDVNANKFVQANRLRFLAQSCSLPFTSLDMEKRNTGAAHFSGFSPPTSFTVDFLETNSFTALDFFEDWQDRIYDKNKRVWRKGNNRALGIIFLLQPIGAEPAGELSNLVPGQISNPVGVGLDTLRRTVSENIPTLGGIVNKANLPQFKPVRTYLVEGMVPMSIGDIDLSYDSSEQIRIPVEFNFNQIVKPGDKIKSLIPSGVTDFGENVLEGFPDALKSGGNALKGFWQGN